MDLKRFFSEQECISDEIILSGNEFIHAVKVTRHKVGYKIIVCNGQGYDYYGEITEIGNDFLRAKVEKKELNDSETKSYIRLYIGANKDLDTVAQKAVELGIKELIPFTSQHGNTDKINIERLKKIVLESSKQCGRASLMKVFPLVSLQEITNYKQDNNLIFYEFEKENNVSDAKIIVNKPINIFIGSEGGFSEKEIVSLKNFGAQTFTLGKRILRVCTAVVSGITLIEQKLGEI